MQTKQHQLLSGETITVELRTADEAQFFARLQFEADNETTTEAALVDVMYGPDNPILTHGVLEGRGLVTREVFARPLYHAMLDLLDRKRLQVGGMDADAVEGRASLTVREAAERLGISDNAVRQALAARRLSGTKIGGQWRLDASAVESYKPSRRGLSSPVEVVLGNTEGMSFRVKHPGQLEDKRKVGKRMFRGQIAAGWKRFGIIITAGDLCHFFEFEPGPRQVSTTYGGPFSLRGRYEVVRDVKGQLAATDAFAAFEPE